MKGEEEKNRGRAFTKTETEEENTGNRRKEGVRREKNEG